MIPGRPAASVIRRWPGWVGAACSIVLHAALFALLWPRQAGRVGVALADPPVIEIEMVDQAARVTGRPATQPGQPPQPKPTPPPPPPQQAEQPRPPPPTPTATPPMPPGHPSAAVNLGNADEDEEALRVTGDIVAPPRPDALFRNKPPSYPMEAARHHREGDVLVRARVGTAGVPEAVGVANSSGDASLDRAAIEAVQLWRFQPARNNGAPVAFDYEVNIRFRLGER